MFVLSFCCVCTIQRDSFRKLLLELQLLEDKLKRGLISTGQYGGDDDSGRETDENADTKTNEKSIGIADDNILDLSLKVTHAVWHIFIYKTNIHSNCVLYSWTSFRFQVRFRPTDPHVHSRRWLIQIEQRQFTKENDRLHIQRATRVCWREGQPVYRFRYHQGKLFNRVNPVKFISWKRRIYRCSFSCHRRWRWSTIKKFLETASGCYCRLEIETKRLSSATETKMSPTQMENLYIAQLVN